MLYDPKWSAPSKPATVEDLSLADFISWLGGFPPERRYDFAACKGECLMGQYMAARGIKWGHGDYTPSCRQVLGPFRKEIEVLAADPQTFGAALWRARQLQYERNGG